MKKSMKKLTILHVSDFHFEACAKDEIKNIVSKLLDDIKKVQTEKDIFIDLVCFTGDLIRCGEQAQCGENQWELAMNMVIRPILNGLRLPDDRFVIAPGNHEIDKTKIVLGLEKGLQVRTIEEISENVRNFHESYKARLAYFYDIIKKSLPMACVKDLGYSYRIQLNGLKVGIACVDSAWRSSGKGAVEKGQLYIGREQIDGLYKDIVDCDVKICMMHHPSEWMQDCEVKEIRKRLAQFNLVLHGHVHEEDNEQIIYHRSKTIYSTAGKLYPVDKGYNGYSIIHVDSEAHKCRIFLRTYFGKDREDFDAAVDICGDGEESYDIFSDNREDVIAEAMINGIQRYFETMSEKYALLKNIDASLTGDSSQILIDPVLADKSEYVKEKEHVDEKDVNINDIMAADDNILLIGKKETGKTTILQRLGLEYCEEYGDKLRVPVYINMKYLPKGADKIKNSAVQFIQKTIDGNTPISRNDILSLIQNGTIVFLIDNVKTGEANHTLWISRFMNEFAKNRYILTIEEEFFQSLDVKQLPEYARGFRKIYIQYMGKAQIRAMVTRWVSGREEFIDIHRTVEQIDSYCNQINIAKTPFNIALFMVIWDEKKSFIPANEGIVMENYLEILLEKLHPNEALRSEYSFRIKQDFLSHIAHAMCEKDKYALTQEEFEKETYCYHSKKGYASSRTGFDKLFFEKNILSKSGDYIVFSHTSFLEYYLALYASKDKSFLDNITRKGNRIAFRNVICFYSGINQNCRDLLDNFSNDILAVVLENIDLVEELNSVKIMTEFKLNKEKLMETLEADRYTQEELDALSDQAHPHKERSPEEIRRNKLDEEEAEDFYSLLMMYGSIIKNTELLDSADRVVHLENYLYGVNMLYAMLVVLNDYMKEHLKFDELSENDKLGLGIKDEAEFEVMKSKMVEFTKLLFPIAIQNLVLENVGTPKLEVAINELILTKKNKPFEKFMLTFLKCDLNIVNLKGFLDKYIKEEKSKDILKIVLMKLTFYYRYRFFGNSPQMDRDLVDLITEIYVRLNPEDYPKSRKSERAQEIKFQLDNMR